MSCRDDAVIWEIPATPDVTFDFGLAYEDCYRKYRFSVRHLGDGTVTSVSFHD